MVLMTAHRAKGLEFDHVLILDGGGWSDTGDEERRLFYVAMTRARRTPTLCDTPGGAHAFTGDLGGLALRSRPTGYAAEPKLAHRRWIADPAAVILSWPGYFPAAAPIHRAIAALDVGSELILRPRSDGKSGWEIADVNGVTVTRMAQKFRPPAGEILAVRVFAIQVRHAKGTELETARCQRWELVLPEIEYLPMA